MDRIYQFRYSDLLREKSPESRTTNRSEQLGVEYALLFKREVYVCAFELQPVFFLSCYLYLLLTSAASNRKRRIHPRRDLQILPIPLGAFRAKSQRF
ncbi:MAG: hypothetical protein DMG52_33165 [Acidobacteria bacterium]|nr:MAG: hypothetical protein DMG52_33165 [Acidobacteriota bacterium]